jgi:hypothetical protein
MSPLPLDDDVVLQAWYRSLPTDQIELYVGALTADRAEAELRPGRAKRTVEFCDRRLRLLGEILRERETR